MESRADDVRTLAALARTLAARGEVWRVVEPVEDGRVIGAGPRLFRGWFSVAGPSPRGASANEAMLAETDLTEVTDDDA